MRVVTLFSYNANESTSTTSCEDAESAGVWCGLVTVLYRGTAFSTYDGSCHPDSIL